MSAPGALICDTSGLLAAADSADPDHARAAAVLAAASGPLVLSPLVIAELDHLLRTRLSADAGRALADDVAAGAYEVAALTAADVAACVAVDRQVRRPRPEPHRFPPGRPRERLRHPRDPEPRRTASPSGAPAAGTPVVSAAAG